MLRVRNRIGLAGRVRLPEGGVGSTRVRPRVTAWFRTPHPITGEEILQPTVSAPVGPDGSFLLTEVRSTVEYLVSVRWPDGRVEFWRGPATPPDPDPGRGRWARYDQEVVFP